MNETRKMGMEIRGLTLLLSVIGCVICIVLFPNAWKPGVMGILIGSLTGIMGFNMIQNMVENIEGELADMNSRAFRSYTRRYLMYTLIFALSAVAGASIVALLIGMLLHKVSIILYSWKHRKEDE